MRKSLISSTRMINDVRNEASGRAEPDERILATPDEESCRPDPPNVEETNDGGQAGITEESGLERYGWKSETPEIHPSRVARLSPARRYRLTRREALASFSDRSDWHEVKDARACGDGAALNPEGRLRALHRCTDRSSELSLASDVRLPAASLHVSGLRSWSKARSRYEFCRRDRCDGGRNVRARRDGGRDHPSVATSCERPRRVFTSDLGVRLTLVAAIS